MIIVLYNEKKKLAITYCNIKYILHTEYLSPISIQVPNASNLEISFNGEINAFGAFFFFFFTYQQSVMFNTGSLLHSLGTKLAKALSHMK